MSKTKFLFILLMVGVMFGSFGCDVGYKIQYNNIGLDIHDQGTCAVAVSTLDSRKYVVNDQKDPSYIGTFRGGYGNPFNVNTESENALAKDMTKEICAALNKKGYTAKPILLTKGDTKDAAISKLKATRAARLILLTLHEWYSDTFFNTSLYYDADLVVMSDNGDILGQSSVKGTDDLGGSFWNPPAHAKEKVPEAYKKNLEALLNDDSVVKALK